MKISRRKFLCALSASLAVGVPAAGASKGSMLSVFGAPSAAFIAADALGRLSWNSFQSNLFTDFEFSSLAAGRRVSTVTRMTLSSVTGEPQEGVPGSDPICFVLTFRARVGTGGPRLSQNTYAVDHFALGRFDLFVSDANRVEDEYVYTAVINRVTK